MDFITIFVIATGLAMDAFAVSVTTGFTIKNLNLPNSLKMPLFFGFFQAIMPLIGWFAGKGMRGYIEDFDHWIAFALLSFIGGKMIYEATVIEEVEEEKPDPLKLATLIGLSIATSIDALAVGIAFSFLKVSIVTPVIIIGIITFSLSFIGIYIGKRFGHFFESKLEAAGGIILIAIGLKILIEHTLLS